MHDNLHINEHESSMCMILISANPCKNSYIFDEFALISVYIYDIFACKLVHGFAFTKAIMIHV